MDEASFVPESDEPETEEAPEQSQEQSEGPPAAAKPLKSRLEQLESDLAEAIAKEDYEKAARLRDEIKRLKALNS
jgi:protein-arginine kinase activator protein McsA